MSVADAPVLSTEQLVELVDLLKGVDSVELKLTVPSSARRAAVTALGMDPLDGQLRQVVFFDTPDLTLNKQGLILRARRVQGRAGDSVVKLRPVDPAALPASLRADPTYSVEVDVLPGGFICSGSMKVQVSDHHVKEVIAGDRPIRDLYNKHQRALITETVGSGWLTGLDVLGPINVLKLKWTPAGLDQRLVAELWLYPNGTPLLELSTKCAPADAFAVAATAKAFLASHGVDLGAPQQTKTHTALEMFSAELRQNASADAPAAVSH
ncbi:adenylate cyclase [Microlunatus elymi]|uniref:Adenylate cyclase n=1 Tax=Microlunatus elymi TaxID=2596828 RepID=A0A516Q4B3_9ACTN|nr:adenylate cyclase [Microlunatus elymi]QDP98244.1 adenylate cyclase [Microlunatus elymi]